MQLHILALRNRCIALISIPVASYTRPSFFYFDIFYNATFIADCLRMNNICINIFSYGTLPYITKINSFFSSHMRPRPIDIMHSKLYVSKTIFYREKVRSSSINIISNNTFDVTEYFIGKLEKIKARQMSCNHFQWFGTVST